MYLSIDSALREEPALSSVFINDFYPYIDRRGTVIVPESDEFRDEAHEMFIDVDYDELSTSSLRKNDILTKIEYEDELKNFQAEFEREFPGIAFYYKELHLLYAQYVKSVSNYEIAGVVQLSDIDACSKIRIFDFLPPEGLSHPINFEGYYRSIKRALPNVEIDISSLYLMYEKYVQTVSGHSSSKEPIFFTIFDDCKDIDDVVNLIEDALEDCDVTDAEIKEMCDNTADYQTEKKFDRYFNYMSKNYKLRDRESRVLLVYSASLVDKFLKDCQDKSGATIEFQRYFVTGVRDDSNAEAGIDLFGLRD